MATYKFRILLDNDKNEEIFRDILISSEDSFQSLYNIIIDAFYFKGDQLASFYLSNDDWDKGQEISLMEMDSNEFGIPSLTMHNTKLSQLIKEENQKLILVYDFMRMWCFLIDLISIKDEGIDEPKIILSMGISPDENSRMGEDDDFLNEDEFTLGNDFEDIFSDMDDEEMDDFNEFEDFDDYKDDY